MNILVVGCGKVGSDLADLLSAQGHDLSVVDADGDSFSLLSDEFTGFTVTGVPIDMDVLRKAGIEGCDVVAAVTQSDNMNVMVAQMAKEIFGVTQVVTRIFDPRRREVFDRLGLNTVCQTSLTVSALESIILGGQHQQVSFEQSSTISVDTEDIPAGLWGQPLSQLPARAGRTVIGLLHPDGRMTMAGERPEITMQKQDRAVFARLID